MTKVLGEAQRLYDEGKWHEAITLIANNLPGFTEVEDMAEAHRLQGWCFYYIGIKGPAEEKKDAANLSRDMFNLALLKTSDVKRRISILNGLPLSLWILGEQKDAQKVSDRAIEEFPNEPSVWNTRVILCRWAKDFKMSVEICEKVYETAIAIKDYRTAGHGKHNKADALINEARDEYAAAIVLYEQFEKSTGQSAKFHIDGVKKKLLTLG